MSLADITEPADKLLYLLMLPRIIYFCVFFAYDGLKNGVSLTHSGMRKGVIARVYGIFYLLFVVFTVFALYYRAKDILTVSSADMQTALFFAVSAPEIGFVFFGLALLLFLVREGGIHFGQNKKISIRERWRRIQQARRFTNWMIALPVAVGFRLILGFPEWVNIFIFLFFTYFSPYTSPRELKKYAIFPKDSENSKKKNVVTDEIL